MNGDEEVSGERVGDEKVRKMKRWGRWRGDGGEREREREWNKEKDDVEFCGIRDSDVAVFGGGKKISLSFNF